MNRLDEIQREISKLQYEAENIKYAEARGRIENISKELIDYLSSEAGQRQLYFLVQHNRHAVFEMIIKDKDNPAYGCYFQYTLRGSK